jgi:hypothetical protein
MKSFRANLFDAIQSYRRCFGEHPACIVLNGLTRYKLFHACDWKPNAGPTYYQYEGVPVVAFGSVPAGTILLLNPETRDRLFHKIHGPPA